MKIKHFAGYGNVNATKVSVNTLINAFGEHYNEIKIRVRGNHERGIELKEWMAYDAYNWLLKKHFCKTLPEYYNCKRVEMITNSFYEKVGNIDEEVCDYKFEVYY